MHAPKLKSPRLPGDIRPRTVGIIGFDGVSALDLIAPLEAFKAARAYREYHRMHSCYEVVLIALIRKRFVSESGVVFKADALLSAISGLDTVIIPGAGGKRSEEVCEDNLAMAARKRVGQSADCFDQHRHLRRRAERLSRRPAGSNPLAF